MAKNRYEGLASDGVSASSSSSATSPPSVGASSLIPGLPDDLACVCLAFVPLWQHGRFKSVSRSWRSALSSKTIIQLRHKLHRSEEFLCLFRDDPALCAGEVFDPRAELWSTFPSMPCNHYTYHLSNFECIAAGPLLFVIGGSLFDSRSFPIDRPVASPSVFKYDPVKGQWEQCSNMKTARGSFACGVKDGQVFVAGGGSRHAQFAAGGDRILAAERYDLETDTWHGLEPGLQRIRAGCRGFFIEDEFWVMGGYGEPRTISGILPGDEYYSDGEVLDVKTGSWRSLEPMWEEGERARLGPIAVLGGGSGEPPNIFMLENGKLLRYSIELNRWFFETELPYAVSGESLSRIVGLDGEVYVIPGGRVANQRALHREAASMICGPKPRNNERGIKRATFVFQVYHPGKRTWRLIVTKPPLSHSQSPPWGAMCVMKL